MLSTNSSAVDAIVFELLDGGQRDHAHRSRIVWHRVPQLDDVERDGASQQLSWLRRVVLRTFAGIHRSSWR